MARKEVPPFVLEQHFFFWMTQVIGARDRQLARELKAFQLRVPEWRALAVLHARKRVTMGELADLVSIDRTTLSRTIDHMQAAGWVTRLSDVADMRVTRLALSTAGERLFVRVWPTVEELNQATIEGLPEPAVGMLRWTLERMKMNLDAATAGKAGASQARTA